MPEDLRDLLARRAGDVEASAERLTAGAVRRAGRIGRRRRAAVAVAAVAVFGSAGLAGALAERDGVAPNHAAGPAFGAAAPQAPESGPAAPREGPLPVTVTVAGTWEQVSSGTGPGSGLWIAMLVIDEDGRAEAWSAVDAEGPFVGTVTASEEDRYFFDGALPAGGDTVAFEFRHVPGQEVLIVESADGDQILERT